MPVFQNTYRKLDRDTAINKYDNKSYYDARNIRIISIEDLQSGAVTNMKGNLAILSTGLPGYASDVIIGSCKIRDYMILFSTNEYSETPSATLGRIWKVQLGKNNLTSADFVVLYSGLLDFSMFNPIEDAVSFYENENVQKVYWTDRYNYLRYANVATYLTTDGLVISGSNSYLDPDSFNIVQEMDMSQPELVEITTGSIPVGMIQYAYRLYKLKGATSNFSAAGRLIPITDKSESLSNSRLYGGSDALDDDGNSVNSGKGIVIQISDLDTDYDRIEVVAIHYSSLNAAPNIYIIDTKPVSSSIYIHDQGLYNQGSYSLEEFVLINNPFTCKTLNAKNNILFAANISQSEYNPEFDARAYRWQKPGATGHCYLHDKSYHFWHNQAGDSRWGYYYTALNINVAPATDWAVGDVIVSQGSGSGRCVIVEKISSLRYKIRDNTGSWVDGGIIGVSGDANKTADQDPGAPTFTSIRVPGVTNQVANMSLLPSDIDAINNNNETKKSLSSPGNIYQSDGSTVGGEGPNIKYSFERKYTSGTNDPYIDKDDYKSFTTTEHTSVPYYYDGVDSPYYNQSLNTWARDEIYRMGVVITDTKGRTAPPTWIGDIRMPNQNYNFGTAYSGYMRTADSTFGSFALPFKVTFEINNLPSDAAYVQIVYVKREIKDKSVLFQGRLGWFFEVGNYYRFLPSQSCSANYAGKHKKIYYFISPEISFYKSFVQGNEDYLEVIGGCTISQEIPTVDFVRRHIVKHKTFTAVTSGSNYWHTINNAKIFEAKETADEERQPESFSNISYYPYFSLVDGSLTYIGDSGTMLLTEVNEDLYYGTINGGNSIIANYRRNVFLSQYGGNSYTDRTRNVYIPAGPIAEVSAGSATAEASWGDTWINFHDQLTSFYNAHYGSKTNIRPLQIAEYIPVETSVNLTYRHDDCFHKVYEFPGSQFLKERGNSEFSYKSIDYSPGWSDLYLINTVYCRRPDAKKYYPAPIDYDPQTDSDTLVMASDMKVGNEDIDPWTQWATNEYINVENTYGPINKLISWKNDLFYFQDDAVGILSVLERSLVQDSEGKNVSLGEGSILQRYDNIVTGIGMSTRFSTTKSLNGLYWYDHKRKRIHRFRDGLEDLTTVKGVNSYLNTIPDSYSNYDNTIDPFNGAGFIMSYNPLYNEVWFTVKEDSSNGIVLLYNEILDNFVSFSNAAGTYQMLFDQKLFTSNVLTLYQENEGHYGQFFGTYYDSYITPVIVPAPNIPTTFTNFEITSEVYNSSGDQVHDKTITSIRTLNDYQDTGVITLSSSNSRRLIRSWKLDAGRDSLGTYKARIRDTYAKVTMSFTNDANNRNIVLHDLVTLYMIPAESMANKAQK